MNKVAVARRDIDPSLQDDRNYMTDNDGIRVMQIISNLDIGGAQEVVRTLAKYLVEDGHKPIVCTLKDGPLRQDIERMGIPVEVLPGRKHSVVALPYFIADMLRLRRALIGLIKKYRVAVVQTHLLRSLDFLVLTLKWGSHVRLVFWTIHNYNFTLRSEHLPRFRWLLGSKRAAHRWLYRFMARWVDGFIGVSEAIRPSLLTEIGDDIEDKITIISNGVDVARYQQAVDKAHIRHQLGFGEEARLMAMVGTFKRQKGHAYLIEATSQIIERFPDLHILLIGDGELRNEMQARVKALNLDNSIHFLGSRNDIPDLLAVSDYFVLPSLWEGLPMALLEAMASALPIIATEVSGSQQVMLPQQTGLLIAPGDVDQLAEAMATMLAQPEQARAMGQAAYKRVDSFYSARKQVQDHVALYQQAWHHS